MNINRITLEGILLQQERGELPLKPREVNAIRFAVRIIRDLEWALITSDREPHF